MIISLSQQALPALPWPRRWKKLNLGEINPREIICGDLISSEPIVLDKANITRRNWFIDLLKKKKNPTHTHTHKDLQWVLIHRKWFNGQWLRRIIESFETVTVSEMHWMENGG